MARPEPSQTAAGTPILPLSYLNFVSRYSSQMDMLSSPPAVFELTHLRTAIDLHLLFALRTERLTSISATFLPVLLDQFFYRLDRIGTRICEALSTGKVDAVAGNLDSSQRTMLNNAFGGPAAARAECIESALGNPATFVAHVWQKFRYVRCLSSASFSVGRSRLRERLGNYPIFSPVFAASEAFLGFSLNPEDDPPQYALLTEDAFLEFLPDTATAATATLFMDEVALGEIYHVIVTTYEGFYRYRLGDRVKVVGFWGAIPVVELLGRAGMALNAFGEKTPEEALVNAVRKVAENTGLDLHEFAATIDWSPATYVIYVGTRSAPVYPKQALSQMMDDALRHYNPDYEDFRWNGSLAQSRLEFVPMESLQRVTLGSMDGSAALQKKVGE